MLRSIFRVGRFLTVMTTLLALIGMATSAQAASFRRGWDPLFNAAFSPTLGWRGEAVIFVSDLCVVANDTVNFNSSGVTTCGSANIESYTLEFYDIGNPLVILDSASDIAPGSPIFPAISSLTFDGGLTPNGVIANGVSLWGDITVLGPFNFPSSINNPNSLFDAILGFNLGTTSLELQHCNFDDDVCFPESFFNDANINPTVEWSRVDEVPAPAPLALLGIGLLALSLSRRRKA